MQHFCTAEQAIFPAVEISYNFISSPPSYLREKYKKKKGEGGREREGNNKIFQPEPETSRGTSP